MFKVINQDWAWWHTNTNEWYYSFLSPQTTIFFLLSLGLLQASMIALFHLQSKELEGQKVTAFAKTSAGLFICWVGKRKRKGWFNTRITGKNISMEVSSTRAQTFPKSLLPLCFACYEAYRWKLDTWKLSQASKTDDENFITNWCLLPTPTALLCEEPETKPRLRGVEKNRNPQREKKKKKGKRKKKTTTRKKTL